MKNNETFFAVKLMNNVPAPGNYLNAETDPSFPFSPDGDGFALDIWFALTDFPSAGKQATLFACGEEFQLLVEGEYLYLKIKNQKNLILNNFSLSINRWYNICLSFSNMTAVIFLDGILMENLPVENFSICAEKYTLGAELKGFIRTVRVYKKYLTASEYVKLLYAASVNDLPQNTPIFAWYDFSRRQPEELIKKYRISLMANSVAYVVNLFHFDKKEMFTFTDDHLDTTSEYTLLAKLCFEIPTLKFQYIFSRTTPSQNSLSLKLVEENGLYKIVCDIGNMNLQSELYEMTDIVDWFDIAITFGSEKTALYINGVEKKSCEGFSAIPAECKCVNIGNLPGGSEDGGFSGVISYIAEFSRRLSAEEINSFIENPPFIFDEKIHSLYSFDQEYPQERVSGKKLLASDTKNTAASKFVFKSGTARQLKIDDIYYNNSGRIYQANPHLEWKVRIFTDLFGLFINNLYGVSPSSGFRVSANDRLLLSEAASLLYKNHLNTSQFEYLLIHAPHDYESCLEELFCKYADSPLLNEYINLFYTGNYFKKTSLSRSVQDFLKKASTPAAPGFRNTWREFVAKATPVFEKAVSDNVPFDNGTLRAQVLNAVIKTDGTGAVLSAKIASVLDRDLTNKQVFLQAFGDPAAFLCREEVTKTLALGETEVDFDLPVEFFDPEEFENYNIISFTLRMAEDEYSSLLSYYTLQGDGVNG